MNILTQERLFHVSEERDIDIFYPRTPSRKDLSSSPPLVWAICESRLDNFLTPRDCPRVCFHRTDKATDSDLALFSSRESDSVIAIESAWFHRMKNVRIYLYEFSPDNFVLQDASAGYYVSEKTEKPISVTEVDDVFSFLFSRGTEIRILDNLWPLAERVKETGLDWSLCRMKNAKPFP